MGWLGGYGVGILCTCRWYDSRYVKDLESTWTNINNNINNIFSIVTRGGGGEGQLAGIPMEYFTLS